MRKLKLVVAMTTALVFMSAFTVNDGSKTKKVKILLMGDSTTIGGKPILGESIEKLIMAEEGMPEVEVINVGRGGDTAYELINSGRYDKEIKGLKNIDYIFFRYGINDWNRGKAHRKNRPFEEYFKIELKDAITRVKKDFPKAEICMMSIISWRGEEVDGMTNDFIEQVAKEEKLEFFDIYTPYKKKEAELGKYSMRVRFAPLSVIPPEYHEIVAPFTKYVEWKDTEMVRVNTNEFDPMFGHIPEWYKDLHPNTTGYRFIADETAKYILPKLKNKAD